MGLPLRDSPFGNVDVYLSCVSWHVGRMVGPIGLRKESPAKLVRKLRNGEVPGQFILK